MSKIENLMSAPVKPFNGVMGNACHCNFSAIMGNSQHIGIAPCRTWSAKAKKDVIYPSCAYRLDGIMKMPWQKHRHDEAWLIKHGAIIRG